MHIGSIHLKPSSALSPWLLSRPANGGVFVAVRCPDTMAVPCRLVLLALLVAGAMGSGEPVVASRQPRALPLTLSTVQPRPTTSAGQGTSSSGNPTTTSASLATRYRFYANSAINYPSSNDYVNYVILRESTLADVFQVRGAWPTPDRV